MSSLRRDDITLLATADWDNPFWTNKQHVAVELAARGHRVLYIDSLGLRRPTLKQRDRRRMLRRLGRGLLPARRVRDNLWVWSPLVLPLQEWRVVRHLNRCALEWGLRLQSRRLRLRSDLLWTYNPLTMDVIAARRYRILVYHCVDAIDAQPGMATSAIAAAEERLVAASDIVFATSPYLAERCRRHNPRTHYLPNVADYDHFARAGREDLAVPDELARLPSPRIGFVGALSGYKVDFDLLRAVASRHPEWSFVLIGQLGEGDPWTDVTGLEDLGNVHLLGPRPYEVLPAYLKGCDVMMLPNRHNDYTRGMFPMKFFEYLAAGKPVVAVDLPALAAHRGLVYGGDTPEAFGRGIEQALSPADVARRPARLQTARQYTYATRTAAMLERIAEVGACASPS